jgi:thiol-disulfide isomerase/thioredoxin
MSFRAPKFAILLFFAICGPAPVIAAGDAAPDISHKETLLAPMAGRPVAPALNLSAIDSVPRPPISFGGRVTVVNFWASWCPQCIWEFPSLQRAASALEKDGIAVLTVNVGEKRETARAFLKKHGLSLPTLLDRDLKAYGEWPVRGLPGTFIVDAGGRIVLWAEGARKWDHPSILARIRSLTGKPAPGLARRP